MNEFSFLNKETALSVLGKANGSLAMNILDKINSFICIVDVNTLRLLWVNKFLINTLGYPHEDLIDMKPEVLMKFIHPDFQKKFLSFIHQSHKTDINEDKFYRIKSNHSQWIWVHVTSIPYQTDQSGIITHLLVQGIITDCGWLTKHLQDTQHKNKKDAYYSILSKRENEILKLISQGLTNSEISMRLNLSIHTAKTHRRNIIHKLKVRNSADMVRLSMQHGMLDQ